MPWLTQHVVGSGRLEYAVHTVGGYWRAGGWLMLPLAAATFLILYRYIDLYGRLRSALRTPERCVDELEQRLRGSGIDGTVRRWLESLPGAVPRLARHALARITAGLPAREAVQQCRDSELAPFSHAFYVLGALVVAAPLIGLLGTVFGMVDTFHAVSLRSGETAEMVAGGISQALITTQVGLVAALPGTFGLAHLYRLYRRLCNDIDRCESHLFVILERLPVGDGRLNAER